MTWNAASAVTFIVTFTLTVITVVFHEELLSVTNESLFEVLRDRRFEDHSLLRVIQKKLIGSSVSPVPAQRLVEDLDDDVTGTSYTLPGFGMVKNCWRTWNANAHLQHFRKVWPISLARFDFAIITIPVILAVCTGIVITLLTERKFKKRDGCREDLADDEPSYDDDDDDGQNELGHGTRNQIISDNTDNPVNEDASEDNENEDTEKDTIACKNDDHESLCSDTPCREKLCDNSPGVDEIPGSVLDKESSPMQGHIFPDGNDCNEKEGTEVNVISDRGQKNLERSATENENDPTLWCNMVALDEWEELDSEQDGETARETVTKDNVKQVPQTKHARDLSSERRAKICSRLVNEGTDTNTIQGLTEVSANNYHLEIDDRFKKDLMGYKGGTLNYITTKNDVRIIFPIQGSGFVIIKGERHKVEAACQDIQMVTSRKTGLGRATHRALVKGNEVPPGLIKIRPGHFKTHFQEEELAILIGREGRNIRAMSNWYDIRFHRPIQGRSQHCLIKGTDEDVLAFYRDALLFIQRRKREDFKN